MLAPPGGMVRPMPVSCEDYDGNKLELRDPVERWPIASAFWPGVQGSWVDLQPYTSTQWQSVGAKFECPYRSFTVHLKAASRTFPLVILGGGSTIAQQLLGKGDDTWREWRISMWYTAALANGSTEAAFVLALLQSMMVFSNPLA